MRRGQRERRQNSSNASRRRLGQNRSSSSPAVVTRCSYTALVPSDQPRWPRSHRPSSYRDGVIRAAALEEMSPRDLYEVLALRVAVFVVEQECAYPELDGRDPEPDVVHWWSRDDAGLLTACLRVLVEPGVGHRIGRVASAPTARRTGAAAALMRAAMATLPGRVVLGAQVRVRGFYERLGFAVDGPEYDEDGIPHVTMLRGSTGTLQAEGASSTVC